MHEMLHRAAAADLRCSPLKHSVPRYEEAELAKTRLDQLRMHEENRRREELRSQQLAERLGGKPPKFFHNH